MGRKPGPKPGGTISEEQKRKISDTMKAKFKAARRIYGSQFTVLTEHEIFTQA